VLQVAVIVLDMAELEQLKAILEEKQAPGLLAKVEQAIEEEKDTQELLEETANLEELLESNRTNRTP
jgi:hypothetical protein